MKLNYYYNALLLGMFLMASCHKEILVHEPGGFDVTTERNTYKAGEEIAFHIKGGDVQRISFYSGEVLKDYAFRNERIIDVNGAGATMAFQSSVQIGTQTNQLSVQASTDYKGDDNFASVKAATWTDITDRFALGTGTAFLASGTKDISDLMISGKPIYIAFKYITKPQAGNGLARQWFIQAFSITSKALSDPANLNIVNMGNAGFRIIDQYKDKAPARSSLTATRITLWGNEYLYPELAKFNPDDPMFDPKNPIYNPGNPLYQPTAVRPVYVPYDPASPYNDPLSEHWFISKPIYAEKVDLGPDWSVAIKGPTDPNMDIYRYTYAKPGTYKAVFVVSNDSRDGTKSVMKEITLTIVP